MLWTICRPRPVEPWSRRVVKNGSNAWRRTSSTHAAAIVGKNNLDIVLARRLHLDVDGACLAGLERVRDRVEEQVGQHLAIRPRIAVHHQFGLAFDIENQVLLAETRPQAHGDLFGQDAKIEDALVRSVAVARHLLERLDQLRRAIEIGDQLRGCLAADLEKFVQAGALEIALGNFRREQLGLAFQR